MHEVDRPAPLIQLPRRPERYAHTDKLPCGTYHVQETTRGWTWVRTSARGRWFPLNRCDDPAWMLWPSRELAQAAVVDADWPHWGTGDLTGLHRGSPATS